jgi:hypothetical protein
LNVVTHLDEQRRLYKGGIVSMRRKAVSRIVPVEKIEGQEVKNGDVTVRKDFPESWIFDSIEDNLGYNILLFT